MPATKKTLRSAIVAAAAVMFSATNGAHYVDHGPHPYGICNGSCPANKAMPPAQNPNRVTNSVTRAPR